jgi:hypothetical protein
MVAAMSWLTLLYYGNYALTVITGVKVLFVVAPAYKRTRHRPFLYLTFAFMLRLFDLVCDYTIGRLRVPHGQYAANVHIFCHGYPADAWHHYAHAILFGIASTQVRFRPRRLTNR